jgi:hypothetical protein
MLPHAAPTAPAAPPQLDEYAALVERGQPSFIEVKGVTWCGDSPGSNLTMVRLAPRGMVASAHCLTLRLQTR